MSAKVQPVETYEAVCWDCDWFGPERDESSDALDDANRHNRERHSEARS